MPHALAEGASDALLRLWREQLETAEGRELLGDILCRTMTAVAGGGCLRLCPMRGELGRGLTEALALASVQSVELRALADKLSATVERAEYFAEKVVEG